MNRQIVQLFGFIVVLFAVLVALHVLLVGLRGGGAEGQGSEQAAAARAAADRARPDPRRRRHRPRPLGRPRAAATPCATCAATPKGALYGHPIGYSFVREGDSEFEKYHNDELVGERLGARLDPRRAARGAAGRQRHRHQHRSRGAAGGDWPISKRKASAPWSRSSRARGRVRVLASNPSYDPNRVPFELTAAEPERPGSAAARPRHPGPVPAGLDLQGGDGRGRPRQRRDHAGNDDRRAGHELESRASRCQRLHRGLRRDHPRHGADQLGQHLVRAAGRTARRRDAVRVHGRLRLRLDPGDRPARRPGLPERHLRKRASCSVPATRSTSPASRSARSDCW